MALIEPADITPYATVEPTKLAAMLADASALAVNVAPCLAREDALTDQQRAAAKAVLRSVILRWNDSGSGAFAAQTAGPYEVQYAQTSRMGALWPSDISQLQHICTGGSARSAFAVDTVPGNPWDGAHITATENPSVWESHA